MKTAYLKRTAIFALLGLGFAGYAFTYSASAIKKSNELTSLKKTSAKASTRAVNLKDVSLENIEFDFNKSSIRSSSYQELDRIVKLLSDNKGALKISGHADNIGAYVYNWNLSKKRAESVKEYLINNGADKERIAAAEFGDTKPIASNKTTEGRQKNRRVEMSFL